MHKSVPRYMTALVLFYKPYPPLVFAHSIQLIPFSLLDTYVVAHEIRPQQRLELFISLQSLHTLSK